MERVIDYFQTHTGLSSSTLNRLFVSVVIIFLLWGLRMLILRIVWRRTENVKLRYQWKRSLSFFIPFLGLVLVSTVWLHAFRQLGAFLGLVSAGLAIALKDPVTNIAGWFFIVLRKPFAIGDRVQIGENKGDVIDIRLFQFTILEVGNWVDADQSTGRIIHIPCGKVFLDAQANYSSGFKYIWDELAVSITFESNWEKAKGLLDTIASRHAQRFSKAAEREIIEASKNYMIFYQHLTPIVYVKVRQEYGVTLTIRFLCDPRKRRMMENEIWQDILQAFAKEADIDLAYPTQRFYNFPTEKLP
ncbi:mechanosensitive ion channel family protein [Sunxiuqinia elliptica]|uniref:Small-conductance mechanosensitive channel n=1 Tax=Sunxiuqinia elliptica TaxID=655355 RepID=A0A1I2C7P3_9BACT|nr:mechanosensitive ion channel family protein [Sunxiuqinia elliptica]SFE64371.1 Small-conductance mechanosensitive channel [Sunxiuqinia elliptica]